MSGSAWSLELLDSVWFIPFMIIVVPIHVIFLHGIRKEITIFMLPLVFLYAIFMIVASIAISILGMRGTVNVIWFGKREVSRADVKWTSMYLAFIIYGRWVEGIYKATKKKEEAKEKIRKGKKNKGGWKNTIFKKTLACLFDLVCFESNLNMNNGINASVLDQNEVRM